MSMLLLLLLLGHKTDGSHTRTVRQYEVGVDLVKRVMEIWIRNAAN